ncbi:MAG: autotransporter domain-containing protein [Alphaproteobacteria bacterium]|nr:autotransporter domain-containing protein [Alphaproteobacteria bacterium]
MCLAKTTSKKLIKNIILEPCLLMSMALGITKSALAANKSEDVYDWLDLESAIQSTSTTINVHNNITFEDSLTISKEKSLVGVGDNIILSGDNQYSGFYFKNNGNIENISLNDFVSDGIVGAVYNEGKTISIVGNFDNNIADGESGGAIYNDAEGKISSKGLFSNNKASKGGAIYNTSDSSMDITGDFYHNSAENGGAIYNIGNVNIIADSGDFKFEGNYVKTSTGKGGAIYNNRDGVVGVYANEGSSITFTGSAPIGITAYEIDSVNNLGILNINGDGTKVYGGIVNLYTVSNVDNFPSPSPKPKIETTNIYGGSVNIKGNFVQEKLNISGGSLSLISNTINSLEVTNLTLNTNVNLSFDIYGSSSSELDTINANNIEGNYSFKVVNIEILNALTEDLLTTDAISSNSDLFDNVSSSVTTITSGGNMYDVSYDPSTGKFTFTKKTIPIPPPPGPIPLQKDVVGTVQGVVSNINNTINSANNAVKSSIKGRLTQLGKAPNQSSLKKGKKGRSGGDDDIVTYGLWVQGIYSHVNRDKTASSTGFKGHSEGVVIGGDAEFVEDMIVGFAYAYTNSNMKSQGVKSDIDTHGFYTYGQYQPNSWFINGTLGFGLSKAEPKKSDKKIKSKFYSADVMSGYEFKSKAGKITPAGGLRYVRVEQDSYREEDTRIKSKNADTLTAVAQVGWQGVYKVKGQQFKAKASVGVIYDIKSENNKVTVSSAGAKFMSEDGRLKRFGTEVSAGVDTKIAKKWNVSLDYSGEFRQHYENHTGTVSVRYDF